MKNFVLLPALAAILFLAAVPGRAQSLAPLFKDGHITNMKGEKTGHEFGRKKTNVFFVWASWCPHCKRAAPDFVRFVKEMEKCDLSLNMISIDRDRNDATEASKSWSLNDVPLYSDPENRLRQDVKGGVPKLVVTDDKGNVLKSFTGDGGREGFGGVQLGMKLLKDEFSTGGSCVLSGRAKNK